MALFILGHQRGALVWSVLDINLRYFLWSFIFKLWPLLLALYLDSGSSSPIRLRLV